MLSRIEKAFFRPDPEKILNSEKNIRRPADPDELKEAQRKDLELAEKLARELKSLKNENKDKKTLRQKAESIFMRRQKVLYAIARRFHPFSDTGIKALNAAKNDRERFEMYAGRLIAAITGDRSDVFAVAMSVDLREAVENGKYRAIGILQEEEGTPAGVGALAYYFDDRAGQQERIMRIVWLYVHPDFRRRGCGDMLLAEALCAAKRKGAVAVTLDFNVDDEYESFGYLLDRWGFGFTPAIDTDFACLAGDISEKGMIERTEGKARSLSELPREQALLMIDRFLARNDYKGYISSDLLPEDYIDLKLSFFTGSSAKTDGLLLAHRRPTGNVSAEYVQCTPEAEDDMEYLLCNFALKAKRASDQDDMIMVKVDSDEDAFVLDEYFPKQMGRFIVGAILQDPDLSMR